MMTQLTILSESLDRKLEVLGEIERYNLEQEKSFSDGRADLGQFDGAIEEKGRLIQELQRLDEGFEALYAGLAEELSKSREKYAEQIREIQGKIALVTEKSVAIQAQEKRNKALIEQFFSRQRGELGRGRRSSRAAYDYYRNMSQTQVVPPQFMDSKQ